MDPDKQVLLREGQPVAVTPKAFETLLVLVPAVAKWSPRRNS